jgi:hypothetical protein
LCHDITATGYTKLSSLARRWYRVNHNQFPNALKDVNLWMDSSDFRLIGKKSVSTSDSSWSQKCNSPGQRYQFIMDGKSRIRKIWGGMSPKVDDGNHLRLSTL